MRIICASSSIDVGDPRIQTRVGLLGPMKCGLIVQGSQHDFEFTVQAITVIDHAVWKSTTHGAILNHNICHMQ